MTLSAADRERYSRHLALREIDEAGQEKLQAARVLLIGAGGLGSPAALYLVAAGIGTLGIVDCDRVDVSNLQRQVLYDAGSVSQPKTEAARNRLLALNPDLTFIAHQVELRAANVLEIFNGYDLVLDGTDRFATRFLANDACVILRKPLVSAAIHSFEGQALTYIPDRSPCYRCLFPEPPADGLVPSCAEAGVLGVLPGVMGTIQATEAIKVIIGIGEPLLGRLLTYDALEMRFTEFRFTRRNDCAVCSGHPTITQPQDPPELCSTDALAAVTRFTARELRAALLSDTARLAVIDVRESGEFAAGHLPGAIHIPVTELAQRLSQIPADHIAVFVCRSGVRSLTACRIAARASFKQLAHLEGGLLAWAQQIDANLVVAPAG